MASSDESESMIHGHKGKLVIKGNQVKEFPQLDWYLAACGQCPIVCPARRLCQCACGCRRRPGARRQCLRCHQKVGPCCLMPGYGETEGTCHMCRNAPEPNPQEAGVSENPSKNADERMQPTDNKSSNTMKKLTCVAKAVHRPVLLSSSFEFEESEVGSIKLVAIHICGDV